ncbi:MAG TPA: hypothetical protein VHX37_12985 [Acidobacteriaceae bacterium]|jgi:ribosomal protein L37AE/L43A|nr:hypothetical protein [Acidobacteriaceae bacterium]
MQHDPGSEWQRLTHLYDEKSDEELADLAADFGNLTEVARQVLRDEMKKRGLSGAASARPEPTQERRPIFGRWSQAIAEQNGELAGEEREPFNQSDNVSREYTWKILLCTCDSREEAWQISEVLRRANIDSWIEAPAEGSLEVTGPRVVVAADQIGEAREVAARPIPQDIVDQSKTPVEDFRPPSCPRCGATDPLLEGVEPVNQWSCENCGAQWNEAATTSEECSS